MYLFPIFHSFEFNMNLSWEEVWFFSGRKCQFWWTTTFLWWSSWWNYSYQRNPQSWALYLFEYLLSLQWYCRQLQKELLLWHWMPGVSIYHICGLMQPIDVHESSKICHEMPTVITSIFKSTPNRKIPYLLFVNPVNWLVLSAMYLKLTKTYPTINFMVAHFFMIYYWSYLGSESSLTWS